MPTIKYFAIVLNIVMILPLRAGPPSVQGKSLHQFKIAPTNCIIGNQLKLKPTGNWLGVYYGDNFARNDVDRTPKQVFVEPCKVALQQCDDLNFGPGLKLNVISKDNHNFIWLIQGLSDLFSGNESIKTAQMALESDTTGQSPNAERTFIGFFDKNKITLVIFTEETGRHHQITIKYNNYSQTLIKRRETEEGMVGIDFVGDLDKDGKPDFLILSSDKYTCIHHHLFLSTLAKDRDLVGKAAEFLYYGD